MKSFPICSVLIVLSIIQFATAGNALVSTGRRTRAEECSTACAALPGKWIMPQSQLGKPSYVAWNAAHPGLVRGGVLSTMDGSACYCYNYAKTIMAPYSAKYGPNQSELVYAPISKRIRLQKRDSCKFKTKCFEGICTVLRDCLGACHG